MLASLSKRANDYSIINDIDAFKQALDDDQAAMLAHRVSTRYRRGAIWHRLGQMDVERERFYILSNQYARSQYRASLSQSELANFDAVVRYSDSIIACAKAYGSGDKKAGFEQLKERNRLAHNILQRSGAIYEHLYFEQLNEEKLAQHADGYARFNAQPNADAPEPERSTPAIQDRPVSRTPRLDAQRINATLMDNPEQSYLQILGEPVKRESGSLRYPGGLIVTTQGASAGLWHDFGSGRGGAPIQAIEYAHGLSYKEALQEGAKLSGLSEAELVDPSSISNHRLQAKAGERVKQGEREQALRIEAARSLWAASIDAKGSLVEEYMATHRNIYDISNLEIRYLPIGASYQDFVKDKGSPSGFKTIEKTNKVGAMLIVSKDTNGQVMGVQRTYLDSNTANKSALFDNPKLSKGLIKHGALLQTGINGTLYIAEGAETAASVALADREASVMVSMSVSNMKNMVDSVRVLSPDTVILLKDNDGANAKSNQGFEASLNAFREAGFKVSVKMPAMLDSIVASAKPNTQPKTDWNDVLQYKGLNALRDEVGIAVPQAYEKPYFELLDQWRSFDKIVPDSVKDRSDIIALKGYMDAEHKTCRSIYNIYHTSDNTVERARNMNTPEMKGMQDNTEAKAKELEKTRKSL